MAAQRGPITFVDVETTGLTSNDRVVSIGIIAIDDIEHLARGDTDARIEHLVFNPGRPSHPAARKVHGFSDEFLAMRDPFAAHAQRLRKHFVHGGPIYAHNVSFDRRFITSEFGACSVDLSSVPFECTMLAHRRKFGGPSGLDAVLTQMGSQARKGHHGALVDAWQAMRVYCWLNEYPVPAINAALEIGPQNIDAQPAAAIAPLPQHSTDRSDAFFAALQTLEPLATIMVRIASADGHLYQTEIEAVSLLMHTTLAGMPGRLAEHEYQDLLATLIELPTDDRALHRAARAIVRNREMREAVAGWVRAITFADGSASEAEHQQIVAVSEAIAAAKASIPDR